MWYFHMALQTNPDGGTCRQQRPPLVTSDETTLQTSNQANLESNNIRYLTYINLYDFLQSFPHNPTNKYPFPRSLHSSFGLASLLSLTSSIKSIDATKKSWLVPLLRVRSHALVFLAKSWIGQNRYLVPFSRLTHAAFPN